jgi:hypothetical protein
LPKLPGSRESRWAHLLSGAPEAEPPAEKAKEPPTDLKATVARLEGELAELKAVVARISKATGIS